MGDRANVVIPQTYRDGTENVYLYTHSGGYRLPLTVQTALARHVRWNDYPYLTRIIFDAMTEGLHGSEIGAGITTHFCDNDGYPLIIVDTNKQEVRFQPVDGDGKPEGDPVKTYSFQEYVSIPDVEWPPD